MTQRLILTEEEKRDIQKMYGMINEQKLYTIGNMTPQDAESFVKKNGNGFFDVRVPNTENFDVMNYYDGGSSKTKLIQLSSMMGDVFMVDYLNNFTKGQIVTAQIKGPEGSKSSKYTVENDGYDKLTYSQSTMKKPGKYELTIDGDDKNKLIITVK